MASVLMLSVKLRPATVGGVALSSELLSEQYLSLSVKDTSFDGCVMHVGVHFRRFEARGVCLWVEHLVQDTEHVLGYTEMYRSQLSDKTNELVVGL